MAFVGRSGLVLILAIVILSGFVSAALTGARTISATTTIVSNNSSTSNNTSATRGSATTGTLGTLLNKTFGSTGSGNTSSVLPSLLIAPSTGSLSSAMYEALKTGPYAYSAEGTFIRVIDTSTRNVVSTIKIDPPPKAQSGSLYIGGVAVSKDGQYVYAAFKWTEYQDTGYYAGENFYYSRVLRINASSQQTIDYFTVEEIRPTHLETSPDGKVYLGYQKARYPEDAGVYIMDFAAQKSWSIKLDSPMIIKDFEFSPDGKQMYYGAWYDYAKFYSLDWNTNKGYAYYTYGNYSDSYQYTRSMAMGKGGKMLYAVVNRNTGIMAMNTEDNGKHKLPTTYIPVTVATSPDGETLYAIGYFKNSDDNPVYVIHKYSGLKTIGPSYNPDFDYTVMSTAAFYDVDSMSYITAPDGNYPSMLSITPDGRFGYVTTSEGDGASYGTGSGIIIYDLAYMNQVKTISGKKIIQGVSISPEKIVYSPPADLAWAKQVAPSFSVSGASLPSNLLYPSKFYPPKGEFAKDYKQDFFVVYASFSDYLDNNTVSNATFYLTTKSGQPVSGHALAASKLAIFSASAQLAPDTDYVAHLSKAIKSKGGNPLYADVAWEFTTRNSSTSQFILSNTTLASSAGSALSLGNLAVLGTPPSNNTGRTIGNKSREWMTEPGLPIIGRSLGQTGNTSSGGSGGTETTGTGSQSVQDAVRDAEQATQLNPQPEPPAPQKNMFGGFMELFKTFSSLKR